MCIFDVHVYDRVYDYEDVCHHVFDYWHVSVYRLPFLWMFISPFSQCLLYLLCMSMCMCLIMSVVYVNVHVSDYEDAYSLCVCGCLSLN